MRSPFVHGPSLAAATACGPAWATARCSVDPAHGLADEFDLQTGLFQGVANDPYLISENLSIHEVNIQKRSNAIGGKFGLRDFGAAHLPALATWRPKNWRFSRAWKS